MSEAVGGRNKQHFSSGKIQERRYLFPDKENYVGGEKIRMLANRMGKSNRKDKVKNVNKTVPAVFIVFSSECIAIKKIFISRFSNVTHESYFILNRETKIIENSY